MDTECNNASAKNTEFRCSCRQLVAVKTPDGIAIKCRRCKQIHTIPFEEIVKENNNGRNL